MAPSPDDEKFCDGILGIIAQELECDEDLQEDDLIQFADLGMNRSAALVIVRKIEQQTQLQLPATVFDEFPDVELFKQHILSCRPPPPAATATTKRPEAARPAQQQQAAAASSQTKAGKAPPPLSVLIRGSRSAPSNTNVFLLPDGSGSAMGYARLTSPAPTCNLWALNSPFLAGPEQQKTREFNCTIEELATVWAAEIVSIQPHGPYVLGGWSAGGYYAFEVMKCLQRRAATVAKLVLVDSPCRTKFEAMPLAVVEYLGAHNLMGNWGARNATPRWLVEHFAATLTAVDAYAPVALSSAGIALPEVFVIWARNSLLSEEEARRTGLDLDVKVSRFLLERRDDFGPNGWDELFPAGTKMNIATMPGHHFNIVHPPHVEHLSSLLGDAVRHGGESLPSHWKSSDIV